MLGFYVCVVDYVGVLNFFIFMEIILFYWKFYLDMLYEMVGYFEEDKDCLYVGFLVFYIDQIKILFFVVQGVNDFCVNIDELDQIV